MQSSIDVAIVTAAGYPGQPEKFEERVAGLLAAFRTLRLPSEITDRHGSPRGAHNTYLIHLSRMVRLIFMGLSPLTCTDATSWPNLPKAICAVMASIDALKGLSCAAVAQDSSGSAVRL